MDRQENEPIRHRIAELILEHRDLDDIITRLFVEPTANQLQLSRLKKRKLKLKDQIALLENMLLPDINA